MRDYPITYKKISNNEIHKGIEFLSVLIKSSVSILKFKYLNL